jgi:parallel beta-helix repeat protein
MDVEGCGTLQNPCDRGKLMRKIAGLMLILASILFAMAGCSNLFGGGGGSSGGGGGSGGTGDTSGVYGTITTASWTADTFVSDNLTVTGSLTIAKGVTVTFGQDVSLYVEAGATLDAVGTTGERIAFTAKDPAKHWRGLYFDDNAIANTLTYCSVSGAGSSSYYAITMDPGSKADIEHCTISGNAAGGIHAASAAAGTKIKSNRFYGNTIYGLVVNANVDQGSASATPSDINAFAASGSTASLGDQYNKILFTGDISSSKAFDVTEVPYLFDASTVIASGGTLTVNPGVVLNFKSDQSLWVSAGGTLSAVGTSASGITFTGASSATQWRGLYFDDNAIANTLTYCSVSGAGSSSYYAITMDPGSKADIEYCTISGNAAGGVYALGAASGNTIANNTFGSNGDSSSGPYDLEYETGFTSADSNNLDNVNEVIGE